MVKTTYRLSSGRRHKLVYERPVKMRVTMKPQFHSEGQKYCYDPTEGGYKPFQYSDFECKVLVDQQETEFELTQDFDTVNVAFTCRAGSHQVVILHIVTQNDRKFAQIDFAGRVEIKHDATNR